ncbi:MAG: hypothetical protein WA742_01020 [Candidatus Cybelea sp.]
MSRAPPAALDALRQGALAFVAVNAVAAAFATVGVSLALPVCIDGEAEAIGRQKGRARRPFELGERLGERPTRCDRFELGRHVE